MFSFSFLVRRRRVEGLAGFVYLVGVGRRALRVKKIGDRWTISPRFGMANPVHASASDFRAALLLARDLLREPRCSSSPRCVTPSLS